MDIATLNREKKPAVKHVLPWRDLLYGAVVLALSATAPLLFYASKNFTLYFRESILYSVALAGLLGAALAVCCICVMAFLWFIATELKLCDSREALVFLIAAASPLGLYAYARAMSSPFALAGMPRAVAIALALGCALSMIAMLFIIAHGRFLRNETDALGGVPDAAAKRKSSVLFAVQAVVIFLATMTIARIAWGNLPPHELLWEIAVVGVSAIILSFVLDLFGKKVVIFFFLLFAALSLCVFVKSASINDNLLKNPDGRHPTGLYGESGSVIRGVGESGCDSWRFYAYHSKSAPTGTMSISQSGFLRAQSAVGEIQQVGLSQAIENYASYAGKTLTLSARIRGDSDWSQVAITDGTQGNYVFDGYSDIDGRGGFNVVRATITVSAEPKELTVYIQAHRAQWVEVDWVKLEYGEHKTAYISPYSLFSCGPGLISFFCVFIVCLPGLIRLLFTPASFPRIIPIMIICIVPAPLMVYFITVTLGGGRAFQPVLSLSLLCSVVAAIVFALAKRIRSGPSEKNSPSPVVKSDGAFFLKAYNALIAVVSAALIAMFTEFAWRGSLLAAVVVFIVLLLLVSSLLMVMGKTGLRYFVTLLLIFSVISSFSYLMGEIQSQNNTGERLYHPPAAMPHTYELKTRPNIYFILAESMHSQKGLKNSCGWDYPDLQNALAARDFRVNDDGAAANYFFTLNSIFTTLSMRHHLYDGGVGNNEIKRFVSHELADNNIFRLLRNNGYHINIYDISNYIFREPPPFLSYSNVPLKKSCLHQMIDFFCDINSNIEKMRGYFNDRLGLSDSTVGATTRFPGLAESFERNMLKYHDLKQHQFFFMHFGAVHIDLEYPDPGFPHGMSYFNQLDGYKRTYAAGHEGILRIVDVILKSDPEALIVILGDHGSGMRGVRNLDDVNAAKANGTMRQYGVEPPAVAESLLDVMLAIRWPFGTAVPDMPKNGLSGVTLFPFVFSALNGIPFDENKFEENISFFPNAKNLKVVARNGEYLKEWRDFGGLRAIPLAE